MKAAPSRWTLQPLLCLEIAALGILACLLLAKGVLPGWHRLDSDFPNYYLVARLLREGYRLDRIYDWIWLQRIKDHWGIDQPLVGFAGLTPLSSLPVLPIAGYSALTAKRLWIVMNLLFLWGSAEALVCSTHMGRRRVWLLSLLAILPLRSSFLLGQMHIVVLFFLALAYLLQSRRQGVLSGICIAFAGALKIYPLLFIFFFAWKRQWRQVFSIAIAAAALTGLGYACFGNHLMHVYLAQILPRSMQGEVIDPYNIRAASGAALFHRLFLFENGLNPAPVWNRPVLYSIFYPLWQAAILFPTFLCIRRSGNDGDAEKMEWAVFLLALLILSPVPSSYHFVVLILPVVLAADVLIGQRALLRLALVIVLYFLVCFVSVLPVGADKGVSFLTVLAFSRLWASLLLWLVLAQWFWPGVRNNIRWRAPQLMAGLIVFWIYGFVSYQRHFAHLQEDLQRRLHLPADSLLATGIQAKANGFVATVMSASGYEILDQNGQVVVPAAQGYDQLSSAATAGSSAVFVENADRSGSRILSAGSGTPPILNAENPALSADASSLAYIREEKGRGTLRLARLAPAPARDMELVGGIYDVRDAAFAPSGYIVFTAARINGKTGIYRINPSLTHGATPSVLVPGDEEVEAGSVSPDGQWLAFRKLLDDRWQLVTMNLASHRQRQLTFGDCNASEPAWMSETTIAYATDCGRGLGLTALAAVDISPLKEEPLRP